MSCRCEKPLLKHVGGRETDSCLRCFKRVDPACLATDETMGWFFQRLEEGLFKFWTARMKLAEPWGEASEREVFWALRDICFHRRQDGQEKFGLDYLARKNLEEAAEEIADGLNYLFFDVLQNRRATGRDNDLDVVLQTCHHGVKFFEGLADIKRKRKGSPEIRAVQDEAA